MSKPRIGLIGCGAIAEFHVPALIKAGLEVSAVAGSPGSARAREFATRHNIARVFETADDLLGQKNEFDGILIAVPVSRTLEILRATIETGLPVLVEKPISYKSSDLDSIRVTKHRLIVGYNRGTVSRLWLYTSGSAAATNSVDPSFLRKSGVSTSIVVFGQAARMASMTETQCAAPPSSKSSRSTEVITT